MQTQRQLTTKLPWVATFFPTIPNKFRELDSALNLPPSQKTNTVCLSRAAVEEIAYSELTPSAIAINFLEVLKEADLYLRLGVPSFRIYYVLTAGGLNLQTL